MSEIREKYHYDEMGDRLIVKRTQDVEPVIENVKKLRQMDGGKISKEWYHAASIPENVLLQFCKNNGVKYGEIMNNQQLMKRFLNSPEYSAFRVWEGRV